MPFVESKASHWFLRRRIADCCRRNLPHGGFVQGRASSRPPKNTVGAIHPSLRAFERGHSCSSSSNGSSNTYSVEERTIFGMG